MSCFFHLFFFDMCFMSLFPSFSLSCFFVIVFCLADSIYPFFFLEIHPCYEKKTGGVFFFFVCVVFLGSCSFWAMTTLCIALEVVGWPL